MAKYYRREPGSDFVERMFADAGAQRLISRLAMVEIESAFATKIRTGEIDRETVLIARRWNPISDAAMFSWSPLAMSTSRSRGGVPADFRRVGSATL